MMTKTPLLKMFLKNMMELSGKIKAQMIFLFILKYNLKRINQLKVLMVLTAYQAYYLMISYPR